MVCDSSGIGWTWCNHTLAVMEQDTVWNPYCSCRIVRYFPAFICGLDYIVVLGAQMRQNGPSIVLQYRLDEAIKYLNDNPDTICIVSGGQGYNEPCTEAQGMAEYLEKKGVPKVRILMETESTTTAQNISNSMQYIREGATVGIGTNNFHMFRALQIAKKQGLTQVCGIAAKSKPLYLPNNMLREYLAEIKYLFPTKPIRVILQTESKDIHSK